MSKPDVLAMLERVRSLLPAQGPIKDFMHQNPLQALSHLDFDDAKRSGAAIYAARQNLPFSYFREKFEKKEITFESLDRVIMTHARSINCEDHTLIRNALMAMIEIPDMEFVLKKACALGLNLNYIRECIQKIEDSQVVAVAGVRERVKLQLKPYDLESVNPTFFRLVGAFLDQGISLWQFPFREAKFFNAISELANDSAFAFNYFVNLERLRKWLKRDCHAVISEVLFELLGDEDLFESYIRETLFAHAGWSGLVNQIEMNKSSLLRRREITLLEFLAFKLILECEFVRFACPKYVPIHRANQNAVKDKSDQRTYALSVVYFLMGENRLDDKALEFMSKVDLAYFQNIWQEAFEQNRYDEVLSIVSANISQMRRNEPVTVQAVFCLDDREGSFRRHIEEINPNIETFGWAGFFGIDFFFKSLNHAEHVQMCPPIVKPKHYVREVPKKGLEELFLKQKAMAARSAQSFEIFREASSSVLLGLFASSAFGHLSFLRMIESFLSPKRLIEKLRTKAISVPTDLMIRNEDADMIHGTFLGFSFEEMAQRVLSALRGMGLTKDFAPIVAIIAHGSSSINNPHYAAYDCAACSGKPGGPNARVFVMMANNHKVREILAINGVVIPCETIFIGGFHDTATDDLTLFDLNEVPNEMMPRVLEFERCLKKACQRNAKERCRRFASVPLEISEHEALNAVAERTVSLVEPRAELGHSTNLCCIVGPRSLTKGAFLDRRAFLNSYDPFSDVSGEILKKILSAVFPVCGGINLDYYFSRIDPSIYGCGTKLSHNVCGLLGVCNGIDDDLRTGIPIQMTELHDPLRLMVLVYQSPLLVESVIRSEESLFGACDRAWINVYCIDPVSGGFYKWVKGVGLKRYEQLKNETVVHSNSFECYKHSRENMRMAIIKEA